MTTFFDKNTTASMDVDCQRSFTPLCPDELPVPDGHNIVEALNRQAKWARYRVGSKDWHPANAIWIATEEFSQFTPMSGYPNMDVRWNAHCIAGTRGAELLDGLPAVTDYDFMVYKGLERDMHPYGACYHDLEGKISTGLIEFLKDKGVTRVICGGLATNYCVKETAIQLSKHFEVWVNLSACRGIGDSSEALKEMVEHGIKVDYL